MAFCSLCTCKNENILHLYDETGQPNKIYNTIVQYFNPMILSVQMPSKCVICFECWRQIQHFYQFQMGILECHTLPVNNSIEHIKEEDIAIINQETPINQDNLSSHTDCTRLLRIEESLISSDLSESSPETTINSKLSKECAVKELLVSEAEKPLETLISFKMKLDEEVIRDSNKSSRLFQDGNESTNCRSTENLDEEAIEDSLTNSLKSCRDENKDNLSDPFIMGYCKRVTRSIARKTRKSFNKETVLQDSLRKTKSNNAKRKYKKTINEKVTTKETKTTKEEKENSSNACKEKIVQSRTEKNNGNINIKMRQDEFIKKWKTELECVHCETTFDSLVTLRIHFRREHSSQKCFILCCQRKLFTRTQIVEHISLHIDPNSFKCDLCGKRFSERRTLLKHKKEKHTMEGLSRRFKCMICNKGFTKLSILRCHEDMHATGSKDHVCDLCGKAFVLPKRLKVHLRTTHGADRICDQCGRTFRSQRALQDHLMEHAGVSKPKWECDQCDVALNSHASLKRHKEVRHNDGTKEFICDICGKVTYTTYALRSHKKYVHQAVRKHKCNICGKAFKVAIVLREHMASHTGNDLYKCPYCPKTFKVSSNMHHHRKKVHPIEWAEAREKKYSSIIHIIDDSYKMNLLNNANIPNLLQKNIKSIPGEN